MIGLAGCELAQLQRAAKQVNYHEIEERVGGAVPTPKR